MNEKPEAAISDERLADLIDRVESFKGTAVVPKEMVPAHLAALRELQRRRADGASERRAGREEVAAWNEAEAVRLKALGEKAKGQIGVDLLNRAADHEAAAFHIRHIMGAGDG
jgi:hypothetical protein